MHKDWRPGVPSARLSADVEGRSRVEDNRVGTVSLKRTSSMQSRVARATGPNDPSRRGVGAYAVRALGVLVLLVSVLMAGLVLRSSPLDGPTTASIAPPSLGAVESLYSQDLVARINAERAARNSSSIPVPQLQVDPNLSAMAQSWSGQIAANGVVQDPSLPACSGPGGSAPSAGQVCIFAANSGSTGSGYWPGDGSDGMNGDYMASTGHRQNMLAASYTDVGVGVTCSGTQAWTVELFGFSYGDLGPADGRQAVQNTDEGYPVPAGPVVASTQTGDPVYCPGQTVGPNGAITTTGGQYPYPYPVPPVPGEPGAVAPTTTVGMAATPSGNGYWLAQADGSVTDHGDAVDFGSMASASLAAPITHIVATSDGKGYWLVGADGGIFAFGDAGFYGSMGGKPLNAPVVDMAPSPSGRGYWLVAADGGVFAFGDAVFHGSMGGSRLNAPIVGMAAAPANGGYWMVGSDGGVFAFGGAAFHGSMGGSRLNAPVVSMAADPATGGYWMVGSDGGVFAFDAAYKGSASGDSPEAPLVSMTSDPASDGYWLVASNGGVFSYGAPFMGAG